MAWSQLDICAMGGVHAVYQVVTNIFRKLVYKPKYDVWWSRMFGTVACFAAVAFAWIFFRANNVDDAFTIIGKIFTSHGSPFVSPIPLVVGTMSLAILFLKDIKDAFAWNIYFMHSKYVVLRYVSCALLLAYILLFGSFGGGQFIYFQF